MSAAPGRREDFGVALICALPLEVDAVTLAFDEIWEEDQLPFENAPNDYNSYTLGRLGKHNVVLLLLPEMGKISAASATVSLRTSFSGIKLAILCGICGGVPNPFTDDKMVLGDVIISKSLIQYDLGRQYDGRFARKDTVEDNLGRPSKEIRSLIAGFTTRLKRNNLQRRIAKILDQVQRKALEEGCWAKYSRPASDEDVLFESSYLHRHRYKPACGCDDSHACETAQHASCEELKCDLRRQQPKRRLEVQAANGHGPGAKPQCRIFTGRVGSGDTVMKSADHRDQVASEHGIIAFEMEGAVVWDEVPCIIVKAVCDYADSHKNKKWQDFAAATAAFRPRRSSVKHITTYPSSTERKTQIALAYSHWFNKKFPDASVFWVHASSIERFRLAYTGIAQECQIPGRDEPDVDVLKLVKTWLEDGQRRRWLLVIDNADDTEVFFPPTSRKTDITTANQPSQSDTVVGRYIPECSHGSVLITTRNRQVGVKMTRGKLPIQVVEMTDGETNELLGSLLEGIDFTTEEASLLSSRLEHLPLALAQAASFIPENSSTISEYVRLLDQSDFSLVDRLSEILSVISLLDRQAIPRGIVWEYCHTRLLEDAGSADDSNDNSVADADVDLALTTALGTLQAFSFITKASDDSYNMHRLVQLITHKRMMNRGVMDRFSGDAIIADHKLKSKQPFWEREALLGPEHPDTFSSQTSLAYIYGAQGRWCEAADIHLYVLEQHQKVFDADDPQILIDKADLASVYVYLGRVAEAEELCSQAFEGSKRRFGDEHPMTLDCMGHLSVIFEEQGRLAESLRLRTLKFEISKKIMGLETPKTLMSIFNLAWHYFELGHLDKAQKLSEELVTMQKRVLGAEHEETLGSVKLLADVYFKKRWFSEARELDEFVLEARRKLLGNSHFKTLNAMSSSARTWNRLGRTEEAIRLMKECAEGRQRTLGPDHSDTIRSLQVLKEWEEKLAEATRVEDDGSRDGESGRSSPCGPGEDSESDSRSSRADRTAGSTGTRGSQHFGASSVSSSEDDDSESDSGVRLGEDS
ncbi:Nephrocystin-3-like protein 3 [Colletotrichum plurivorum]|uniref:Nephrocystin-3-like protein 3 n=1 Tax=Colletotrichum plurivorum TaxID=2175906 RepID=A0A8H6N9Y5_9PEZI|nr:Nephrocystin-3-like protein 3 [Colletotrichum plurivorum]